MHTPQLLHKQKRSISSIHRCMKSIHSPAINRTRISVIDLFIIKSYRNYKMPTDLEYFIF